MVFGVQKYDQLVPKPSNENQEQEKRKQRNRKLTLVDAHWEIVSLSLSSNPC